MPVRRYHPIGDEAYAQRAERRLHVRVPHGRHPGFPGGFPVWSDSGFFGS
ncbi:MAG: hypothetical protein ABSG86_08380 [Thermoguttaceae bacterium]|jgi:hypothetical protein